ncbi:pre-rRNA processing [Exophiala xenobiotica]|nr:pre-rRNA processing [Exophiala xenobiotica]KAK5294150.1 pre-rRNA processing [Exophiala xenobiotica]KAK5345939.1 pre-rRNA processing [Exophiala xenobiotica]KAK5377711.1 pre-rRNA processing [Exophiala xenobiotica]KAK5427146.1 pre-rRNA processing [Exophiala xenobiotica]
MDHEVAYDFEDEDQFWTGKAATIPRSVALIRTLAVLDKTVSEECDNHGTIDDTLRSYLSLVGWYRDKFQPTDYELSRCAYKLQESALYSIHADYIRRQFVQCLIEDDEPHVVLLSTLFLITDAQAYEPTYELLNEEGAFPRLVDLISSPKRHGHEEIHRSLMELLYEMSRIQKIKTSDLAHVDDDFIKMLFEIIEQMSDDVNDPYHYPTIRVLLVLNEQFMVAAHDPASGQPGVPLTNKVMKVLSAHGSAYKTFGENIILLLNREDETSLQLLTLKLLYLLFTTPPTYEYFYTNDLRVLVDILIRNLLDLPEEASSLRHTYLRVLYPLLEHTQLQYPPHYKREEIRKLLVVLGGGQLAEHGGEQDGNQHWGHFDDVDDTTKRLVKRCEGVSWLTDPENEPPLQAESPTSDVASDLSSPTSPAKGKPPALPAPRKLKKRNSSKASTLTIGQYLTPQLESARKSSLSMMEVAAQTEKPGVITPSRNPTLKNNLRAAIIHKQDKPPPPPQARRSGWSRPRMQGLSTEMEVTKAVTSEEQSPSKPEVPSRHHHHHHVPYPPLPHLRHRPTPPVPDKEKNTESEEKSISSERPSVPSQDTGHSTSKKPPPAPRSRRWRKESGGSNGPREPGKFSANLPSIITTTTTGESVSERSPFSPTSPREKTLSPHGLDSAGSTGRMEKVGVREALEKAQEQAVDAVTETLEHVDLADSKNESPNQDQSSVQPQVTTALEEVEEDVSGEENKDDRPGISRSRSEDDLDQPFHDARQTLSHTPTHASPSTTPRPQNLDSALLSSASMLPEPRVVLTPPGQEPSRGVPGPQYALERSPFLTDEEEEAGEESDNDLGDLGDDDHDDDDDDEHEQKKKKEETDGEKL